MMRPLFAARGAAKGYHHRMNKRQISADVPCGVVFDGDDTLWSTESLYDNAREMARAVVTATGANGEEWEELQRRIDVENVATLGYSPERFPTSCVQAYEQLCVVHGLVPDVAVAGRIRQAARAVFDRDPEIVTGVREVLASLRAQGVRLALLTKGDLSVQRRRVDRSRLEPFFDLVRIVSEKSPHDIRAVVTQLDVRPERAWMVGNSVRSDVLPALEAGIRAIWIRAHVWEYERAHDHLVDDRVVEVSDISEVPKAIHSADVPRDVDGTVAPQRSGYDAGWFRRKRLRPF